MHLCIYIYRILESFIVLPGWRRSHASANSRQSPCLCEVDEVHPARHGTSQQGRVTIRVWWRCARWSDRHRGRLQQWAMQLRGWPVGPAWGKASGTRLAALTAINGIERVDLRDRQWRKSQLQQVQAPSSREGQVVNHMAPCAEPFEARLARIAVSVLSGDVAEVRLCKM